MEIHTTCEGSMFSSSAMVGKATFDIVASNTVMAIANNKVAAARTRCRMGKPSGNFAFALSFKVVSSSALSDVSIGNTRALRLHFLLGRPRPRTDGSLRRARNNQCASWHICGDGGSGPHGSSVRKRYWRNQLGICANTHIIFDNGLMFISTIVVAGDGTCTNIHLLAQHCIPNIA